MVRHWVAIAKADFLVSSSRFRHRRRSVFAGLSIFGVAWAFVLAPLLMDLILQWQIGMAGLLRASAPGMMRSVLLFLWLTVIVYPISYSLQEIAISKWEIILSSSVTTRSILVGRFVARVPMYCLVVLFMAPILLTPFILIFAVSLPGQLIMYASIFLLTISTLWVSTVLSSAVEMRLSQSPRGEEQAKKIAMVLSFVIIVPMIAMMNFAGGMAGLLALDGFLLFPFTWGADIASWAILLFNGVGLGGEEIELMTSLLRFDLLASTLLLLAFGLLTVGAGLASADRLFSLEAGPRTETVRTVGKENLLLRGLRRVAPGPFGVLVVTSLKDFFRKSENVAKLMLGLVVSILPPIMVAYVAVSFPVEAPPMIVFFMGVMIMIMVYPMLGGMTFGGIGFLESKRHLWIIQCAPKGAAKFVRARVVAFFLSALPFAIIPAVAITLVQGQGLFIGLILACLAYVLLTGSALVGVGVASLNPTYETTRSSSFYVNIIVTVGIILG